MKYDYIKGIFAMSCLFMVEVTILDYTMKVWMGRRQTVVRKQHSRRE